MGPNDSKWFRRVPNGSKWLQMALMARVWQMAHDRGCCLVMSRQSCPDEAAVLQQSINNQQHLEPFGTIWNHLDPFGAQILETRPWRRGGRLKWFERIYEDLSGFEGTLKWFWLYFQGIRRNLKNILRGLVDDFEESLIWLREDFWRTSRGPPKGFEKTSTRFRDHFGEILRGSRKDFERTWRGIRETLQTNFEGTSNGI